MVSPRPPDAHGLPETVGRYQVRGLLGEGAMGRVLLAHDPVLGRDVAIKYLRQDLRITREVRDGLVVRMRHEARAAARVMHPHLVTLHDMGEDAALGLYLVFEYVEGPTLKQRLLEGPLSASQAARLARELGAALTVAHSQGIVHRDVKPENIMLSPTGGKVADFGIARIPDSTLTHQGGLMGTPAYSAPETFRAGNFSPASDQFSLAAAFYEALSGERAFPGDDAVTVAGKIATCAPEPFAERIGLPPALDAVLARGMGKRAEDRFPSCEAFGAALAASASGARSASAPPPSPTSPPALAPERATGRARSSSFPPRPERRLGQVALGAAVVVLTAALLVRTALRSKDAQPDPLEPAAPAAVATPSATAAPSSSIPRPRSVRPHASDPSPSSQHHARPALHVPGVEPVGEDAPDAPAEPASTPAPTETSSPAPAGADAGAPGAAATATPEAPPELPPTP